MTIAATLLILAMQTPTADAAPANVRPDESDAPPRRHAYAWIDPNPAHVVATPPPRPARSGHGMLAAGLVLTGIALPCAVFGALDLASDRDCPDCFTGLLGRILMPIAVAELAAGVPLLAIGGHRVRAWRAWQRAYGITLRPTIARTRDTWSAGLVLTF